MESSGTCASRPAPPAAPKRRQQSEAVKNYLAFYNLVQFFGWGYGFVLAVQFLLSGRATNYRLLWEHCSLVITFFQTLQIIEILHAIVRFVPSSPFQTFTQIFSRIVVCWGILYPVVESRYSLGVPLLLIAWTIAECNRYIYYALNIYGLSPFLTTWCRYTLFIVLYPMGVTGELLTMYSALPTINATGLWSIKMPNILNVSVHYDYLIILIMLSYIHFFPQLYFYMLRQRKKVLSPAPAVKSD